MTRNLVIPFIIAVALLSSHSTLTSQSRHTVKLTGRIHFIARSETDPRTGRITNCTMVPYLNTRENVLYRLDDPHNLIHVRSKETVSVSGSLTNNILQVDTADSSVTEAPDWASDFDPSLTTGEQRVLVALFQFPDQPIRPYTLSDVNNLILGTQGSLNTFLHENSYGKTWLKADFLDWSVLPQQYNSYSDTGPEQDCINLVDSQVDFRDYSKLLFFFNMSIGVSYAIQDMNWSSPSHGQFSSGIASIWSAASIQAHYPETLGTTAHEFGHLLGLPHAHSIYCLPTSLIDPLNPTVSCGDGEEYGDMDDPMGNSAAARHFSSIYKDMLGWLNTAEIKDIASSGDYLLDPLEVPYPSTKALRIRIGADYDGRFGESASGDAYYWVEYRTNQGELSGTRSGNDAVQIRTFRRFSPGLYASGFTDRFRGPLFGGTISGQITNIADPSGVAKGQLYLQFPDGTWFPSINYSTIMAKPNAFGYYLAKYIPAGQYFASVLLYPRTMWYNNSSDYTGAQLITVSQGVDTLNINFSMTPLPFSVTQIHLTSMPSSYTVAPPVQSTSTFKTLSTLGGTLAQQYPDFPYGQMADLDIGRPLHDPFRGVKIEFLGKTFDSKARLRVTFSGVTTDPPDPLLFGTTPMGKAATRKVSLINNSGRSLSVGTASIAGRDSNAFSILQDACSNRSLDSNKSCEIAIMFSPLHSEENDILSKGECGLLVIPTDDDIRSMATLSLNGHGAGFGSDLAISKWHSRDYFAGTEQFYSVRVGNVGTQATSKEIAVYDNIPSGLSYVSASGKDWSCHPPGSQSVTCTRDLPLSVGETTDILFRVAVSAQSPSRLITSAFVTSSEDLYGRNNSLDDVIIVKRCPTLISAIGYSNPLAATQGQAILLSAFVVTGLGQSSRDLSVTTNLTAIGGQAAQRLFDDGTNGDLTAGDNIYSYQLTLPNSISSGPKSLDVSISDSKGCATNTSIGLRINPITTANLLPLTISDLGGVSVSTDGSAETTSTGFAPVTPNAGSIAPFGMAVFGYRAKGILTSEAAVPLSPLIKSGRIFVDEMIHYNTGIAIANPNNEAALVSFFFTDGQGKDSERGSLTIPANQHIAKFVSDSPFNHNGLTDQSRRFTLTFNSSIPISAVALRTCSNSRNDFVFTTLPVILLNANTTGPSYFPHYADGGGWSSRIVLINPTDNELDGTVTFFMSVALQQSQPVATYSYSIAPRSIYFIQTPGTQSSVQAGWISILPSGNSTTPSGVAIFSYNPGVGTVTEASVFALKTGNAFRMYAESFPAMQTGIAILNASSMQVAVKCELSTLEGVATGLIGTLRLDGYGKTAMFLNQIPGLESLPGQFQGVLRISSGGSGIAVTGLRGRYNERGDFLISTTSLANEADDAIYSELCFPHFADGGGYTTQFVLLGGVPSKIVSGILQIILK